MSGHGANPVFFNKKNKDWTSEHSLTPDPPTSDNILFFPYHTPPIPLKVDVICVSPLMCSDVDFVICYTQTSATT